MQGTYSHGVSFLGVNIQQYKGSHFDAMATGRVGCLTSLHLRMDLLLPIFGITVHQKWLHK